MSVSLAFFSPLHRERRESSPPRRVNEEPIPAAEGNKSSDFSLRNTEQCINLGIFTLNLFLGPSPAVLYLQMLLRSPIVECTLRAGKDVLPRSFGNMRTAVLVATTLGALAAETFGPGRSTPTELMW